MNETLFFIDFILCLALAILAILLTAQMRRETRQPGLSSLLYFLVFFSAFGLYGIWGQQFLRHILMPLEHPDLMNRISLFISILGVPFLVTAWFMLLKFGMDIRGKKTHPGSAIVFFAANLTALLLAGIFRKDFPAGFPVTDTTRIIFTILTFSYFAFTGISLILSRSTAPAQQGPERRKLGWMLILSGSLSAVPCLFQNAFIYLDLGVTLLFFIGMILPALFLRMHPPPEARQTSAGSFESFRDTFSVFCLRYEISPREREIILELCKGKSNREIADTLFITLQTVKDHLYKIFIKTEVKSRVQLVNLVREFIPEG